MVGSGFIKCGANIVGFVEAPPRSNSSVILKENPFGGIDEVAARLNKPLIYPKSPKAEEFVIYFKIYYNKHYYDKYGSTVVNPTT